jgi:hypothetical protein
MKSEWLNMLVEIAAPPGLFIFGWYALLRTHRLQDSWAESCEHGRLGRFMPATLPGRLRGRANTIKLRIVAVFCIVFSVVLAYSNWIA